MGRMPRYVRPPLEGVPDDVAGAFDALSSGFARAIVNYVSTNPGVRPPDIVGHFQEGASTVHHSVNRLVDARILRVQAGSEKAAGARTSYAYEVDQDRLRVVVSELLRYLTAATGRAG